MSDLGGGEVTLTGSYQRLMNVPSGRSNHIWFKFTLRNPTGNSNVNFSYDGSHPVGYLAADDSYTFTNIAPFNVFVNGVANDVVMWNEG